MDESEAPEFAADLGSEWDGLEGLELGVAGLPYAISNVVLFAGDKPRAVLLQPLVRESGCALYVYAPSIRETMALATNLYQHRVSFRKLPKTGRKQSSPRPKAVGQPTLF